MTAKQCTEQKNGRKCDLATALLPKGDTRATNAKTEYHGLAGYASGFSCCELGGTGRGKSWVADCLGRLVFEVQHDLQDFIRQEVGAHTVHIGQHYDTCAPLRRDQERSVCALLSASMARSPKSKLFGDKPS